MQPEKQVEHAILDYLRLRGIMAWKVQSVGVYDASRKAYRMPGKHYRRGVADILGIYRGYPLAIEVKSATGRVSEDQRAFLAEFAREGGIAIVARSVDDVAEYLDSINPSAYTKPMASPGQ